MSHFVYTYTGYVTNTSVALRIHWLGMYTLILYWLSYQLPTTIVKLTVHFCEFNAKKWSGKTNFEVLLASVSSHYRQESIGNPFTSLCAPAVGCWSGRVFQNIIMGHHPIKEHPSANHYSVQNQTIASRWMLFQAWWKDIFPLCNTIKLERASIC